MSVPRATYIHLPQLPHVKTELWMGGAHSTTGDPLLVDDLVGAWVIDCAGDMPEHYRAVSAWWLTEAFQDCDELPACWDRLVALAQSVSRCLTGARDSRTADDHPAEPPPRLYVFCNQGMNRSGLMVGRILRALGLAGEEAFCCITMQRPGALSNLTFARLVRED
jgi:hypothetical protein